MIEIGAHISDEQSLSSNILLIVAMNAYTPITNRFHFMHKNI